MENTSTWTIRSMPESWRRVALSAAASKGLTIAEYLSSLIATSKAEQEEEPLQKQTDLLDRLASLEARMADMEAKLEVAKYDRKERSSIAWRDQALLALKEMPTATWQEKADFLTAQGLVREGQAWTGDTLRKWVSRQAKE